MKRTVTTALCLLMAGLATLPIQSALAQKPDRDEQPARTVVEIKDGKVYLNGKEVAEIEDAEAPVVFKRSGKEMGGQIWSLDEDRFGRANGFVLRSDDDAEGFRVRSMPRAYGFTSEDGGQVEFFSERDFEDLFEVQEKARRQTAEAMAELELAAPMMGLLSHRSAMSREAVEADQRSRELARSIRRGEGDTAALEAELDASLEQVFDEKQAAQQERADQLRQQLTDLEQRLQQRQDDRSQIISKRRDELLGRDSRFDW